MVPHAENLGRHVWTKPFVAGKVVWRYCLIVAACGSLWPVPTLAQEAVARAKLQAAIAPFLAQGYQQLMQDAGDTGQFTGRYIPTRIVFTPDWEYLVVAACDDYCSDIVIADHQVKPSGTPPGTALAKYSAYNAQGNRYGGSFGVNDCKTTSSRRSCFFRMTVLGRKMALPAASTALSATDFVNQLVAFAEKVKNAASVPMPVPAKDPYETSAAYEARRQQATAAATATKVGELNMQGGLLTVDVPVSVEYDADRQVLTFVNEPRLPTEVPFATKIPMDYRGVGPQGQAMGWDQVLRFAGSYTVRIPIAEARTKDVATGVYVVRSEVSLASESQRLAPLIRINRVTLLRNGEVLREMIPLLR